MRTSTRISSCAVVALLALLPGAARAEESAAPPALVQVPSEDGAMPAEDSSHPSVEPAVTHPPWTGREAIWGGVGLIVAGAAGLIVATPTICFTRSSTESYAPCFATLGGSLGALGLGGIVLVVGEKQHASYKEWLRTHPMFGALSVMPSAHGTAVGWSMAF
jgi:hypothetical protein